MHGNPEPGRRNVTTFCCQTMAGIRIGTIHPRRFLRVSPLSSRHLLSPHPGYRPDTASMARAIKAETAVRQAEQVRTACLSSEATFRPDGTEERFAGRTPVIWRAFTKCPRRATSRNPAPAINWPYRYPLPGMLAIDLLMVSAPPIALPGSRPILACHVLRRTRYNPCMDTTGMPVWNTSLRELVFGVLERDALNG